jgi:uncharacterized protein YkwD
MRRLFSSLLALAIFASGFAAAAVPADAATLDSLESDLVAQVNAFRASKGLTTLVVSDTITFASKWMATDMAVNNYFSHTSLDGRGPTQRMADAGYPAFTTYTGEDLAAGYTSAAEVLAGWIASPGHYAVLINPNYRAIGVGRAYSAGSAFKTYWAANFGGIVDAATTASVMDLGYHAAFEAKSPDAVLAPGQTTSLVVALKNTGYRGWYWNSGGQQAYVGTAEPLNIARGDIASNWLSSSRPATTTTPYVGPGQTGWFKFDVKAPATPGIYRLSVRGVVDGTTWLEGAATATWTITVR